MGLVYPERFIEIAEETGLIVPIGAWVLRTVCKQAKAWCENDGPFSSVAVNLSSRQFLENNLYQTVKQALAESGLNPPALEWEITESAVMQNPENTLQVLRQLRELGVRLSIDDFGTGYSSLTYLRQFPVQSVKIDQSFVAGIPNDEGSRTLISAIIALTHELKLQVIAEGVETEEQLSFLSSQRCDSLQGFFFSRPHASERFESDFQSTQFKSQLQRCN